MSISLNQFTLIYLKTTHPGNLGSIARAAKNMGITDIRLVNPQASISDEQAIANAAGATDVLAKMQIFTCLDSALADCKIIFGTSARSRALNPIITSPEHIVTLAQEDLGAQANQSKIAILFGTEKSGLTNEELNLANYHVVIDANPEYTSLNLAMATLLVSYSIRLQVQNGSHAQVEQTSQVEPMASQADFHSYFTRLEEHYRKIGFIQHSMVIPRLQHLYKKAKLTKKEIDLLQGMLSADIKKE
ncbi:hypothetical protein CJP74_04500 [Psittacicella melopsittaci]|uniref:tRNA (cytidine/uridine-2'-O-)-methyltransferase TrmJ n=1 Tax=Psittacicella melopsittaci TaxID=2028576 RepID=A0A3A1Y4Z3_9GAMM|nr:RNA methyltransferase [Psittacicella melopsittaci]RIY32450.1 hypothetical protein CJP74_04500 [Psittacicella melopsittaci]